MTARIIRAHGAQLKQTERDFAQMQTQVLRTIARLEAAMGRLQAGAWVGASARAFYDEMNVVLPQLERLAAALDLGADVTRRVRANFDAVSRFAAKILAIRDEFAGSGPGADGLSDVPWPWPAVEVGANSGEKELTRYCTTDGQCRAITADGTLSGVFGDGPVQISFVWTRGEGVSVDSVSLDLGPWGLLNLGSMSLDADGKVSFSGLGPDNKITLPNGAVITLSPPTMTTGTGSYAGHPSTSERVEITGIVEYGGVVGAIAIGVTGHVWNEARKKPETPPKTEPAPPPRLVPDLPWPIKLPLPMPQLPRLPELPQLPIIGPDRPWQPPKFPSLPWIQIPRIDVPDFGKPVITITPIDFTPYMPSPVAPWKRWVSPLPSFDETRFVPHLS
jgi:WXG100 family type VII secretion target